MKKIVLLGYMGCGKSTIAQNLSKITEIPFLDLDVCIEKTAWRNLFSKIRASNVLRIAAISRKLYYRFGWRDSLLC